jgi:hypothetical protein
MPRTASGPELCPEFPPGGPMKVGEGRREEDEEEEIFHHYRNDRRRRI